MITRDFELPVELLFRAYVEAELVEEWMGTKVVKLDAKKHGSYQYETTDPKGNKYHFGGAIHDIIPNKKMIRTFEMAPASFGVQPRSVQLRKTDGRYESTQHESDLRIC